MTVVMISIMIFGIGLGYIQGVMDPESCHNTWRAMNIFTKELMMSQWYGMIVGSISCLVIELIR